MARDIAGYMIEGTDSIKQPGTRRHIPWKAIVGMLFALTLGAAIAAHELGLLR